DQLQHEALLTAPDADVREVVVSCAALPEPFGKRQDPQRVGVRIAPFEGLALPVRRRADALAELGEVAEVVTPGGVDLVLALSAATAATELAEVHAGHRDAHDPGHDHAHAVLAAHVAAQHERHDRAAAEHRQDAEHPLHRSGRGHLG